MTRIKSNTTLSSVAEYEVLLDETCRLQLELEKRITKRDKALFAIREEHDGDIEDLSTRIKANVILAEKFATTNRDALFGKLKSAATSLAVYGFRLGNPTLALLNRKWKWNDVLAAAKAKGWLHLIVAKESVDKDAIKTQLSDEERATIGTRIEQEESFFIEPKRDEAPERRLSPEA